MNEQTNTDIFKDSKKNISLMNLKVIMQYKGNQNKKSKHLFILVM